MEEQILFLDPEVRPPEYRVPRGRSGVGAQSALDTMLADLERVRKAREAYRQLFHGIEQATTRH
jgi:hypothetical protein